MLRLVVASIDPMSAGRIMVPYISEAMPAGHALGDCADQHATWYTVQAAALISEPSAEDATAKWSTSPGDYSRFALISNIETTHHMQEVIFAANNFNMRWVQASSPETLPLRQLESI